MVGAVRSTGWVQTVRAVLIAVVFVSAFSMLPSLARAQAEPTTPPPTWPAFPATIEAARAASYTQTMLDAITCPSGDGIQVCNGSERGTNVVMRSTCSMRGGNERSANWCQLSFEDKRYIIRINNRGFTDEVSVDISADTSGEVDPDAPERPPEGWTCTIATEGQYGCDCNLVNVGGAEGGRTRMVCTSPYVTEVSDPGGGGPTVTQTDNADGTISQEVTNARGDRSCDMFGGGNLQLCLQNIIGKLGASVLWVFVQVMMVMVGVVGILFNWIVLVTVFQYATYFGNSEGLLMAWSVLRELGNIFLLFGFIFIGLQTILNIGHFSVGKALPRLLIFAILINFSLFVSSAIVDVSNVFSAAFYSAAGGGNCAATTDGSETPAQCTSVGISAKVMEAAGLNKLSDSDGGIEQIWESPNGIGMFITYFGLLLFAIVMLIVFLAACILLLIRAITLMFLLVLSPLGFAATAIPQFEEYSKMWWNKLLSQAFFAPVFLLMLFVGLKILEGATNTFNPGGTTSLVTAFAAGGTSSGGIFILFALVIGFMIGSLMIASKMGAMGASFATSKASGAVMGGMGFVGRRTVGRQLYKQAEKMRHTEFGRSGLGKMVVGGLDKGAASSFDPRASKLVSGAAGAAHLNLGDAQKGGFTKIVHDAEEDRIKYSKTLKNTAGENEIMGEIDSQIGRKRSENARTLADMDVRHKNDRTPVLDEIAQREREAATARAGGDKAALSAAETAISNLNDKYKRLTDAQNKERAAEEARQKAWIEGQEAAKKRIKSDPQRVYAERMGEMPAAGRVFYNRTAGPEADHHAKEKILANIDKSEIQKLAEALNNQAHPPAPPAGGGTPPPAPH